MKPIAAEIAELRDMRVPELVARYTELHGKPPRIKHAEWLRKRCAWKVQEIRYGGLSTTARKRLDELIAEIDLPIGKAARVREPLKPGEPALGTTLVRQWRGTEVRATRVEGGWECAGVVHGSLSAVVKAVTGSHASGRAWFGLPPVRRARR